MVHCWSDFMRSSVGIRIWLRGWGTTCPGCALERGVRAGRRWARRGGGAEPPQVFLLLAEAHGRSQVLLFTFQSVRK